MNTTILIIAVLIVVVIFAKRKGYIKSGLLRQLFNPKSLDDEITDLTTKAKKIKDKADKVTKIRELRKQIAESEKIISGVR